MQGICCVLIRQVYDMHIKVQTGALACHTQGRVKQPFRQPHKAIVDSGLKEILQFGS
jgi:hypothetical protein